MYTHAHMCTHLYTHTHTRHLEPPAEISFLGRWTFPDPLVERWLFLGPGFMQASWFQGFLISGT